MTRFDDITATVSIDSVDVDTGEVVGTASVIGDPTEIRVPLERLLGWKYARRERATGDT